MHKRVRHHRCTSSSITLIVRDTGRTGRTGRDTGVSLQQLLNAGLILRNSKYENPKPLHPGMALRTSCSADALVTTTPTGQSLRAVGHSLISNRIHKLTVLICAIFGDTSGLAGSMQ